MESPDTRLAAVATEQHALATRHQAHAAGLTDRMIRTRLATGRLLAPAPNVLLVPGTPRTWKQQLLIACLAGGPSTLASHRAAAALHGFDGFSPGVLEVTLERGQHYRRRSVIVHTTTDFALVDRELVDGIPTTTALRTIIDLGAVVHLHRLEEALDSAERDGLVGREELRSTLAIVRCRGHNGVGPLAELLESRVGNQPRSVLERRMLRLLEAHGLPRSCCQYRVVRPDGRLADLDFAYPADRIGIEVDGHVALSTGVYGATTRAAAIRSFSTTGGCCFDYADVARSADDVAETVRATIDASRIVR